MARGASVCPLCQGMHVGDERYYVFECPAFDDSHVAMRLPMWHYLFDCPYLDAIGAQYSNLFQDAAGSMRTFRWHKDQKAVSHCLTAILQMAQT